MVGGVKAKRLSIVEYEKSIEVLNQYGESSCLKGDRTNAREGAAGAFFNSGGEMVRPTPPPLYLRELIIAD